MRQKIFISHANPEDNSFATWLYFKLVGLGYDVWCEIITLKAGELFWDAVENLIRNETIKFLFVSSSASARKRGGVSDEFDFARTIAADNGLDRFMYILKTDQTPYNARIGQHRINHIDFSSSWADGLRQLAKELYEEAIPKILTDYNAVAEAWSSIIKEKDQLISKEEVYSSNIFPVNKLPETLYAHAFKGFIPKNTRAWEYPYAVAPYKDYVLSFADCYDFENVFPDIIQYDNSETIEILVKDILDNSHNTSFISNDDALNKLRFLLNKSFFLQMKNLGFRHYKMANKRSALYYPPNMIEKNKASGILMIGKQKSLKWHYATSGSFSLFPEPALILSAHIVFTEDGWKLVQSDSRQHKARRKQGRTWYNNVWRDKMKAFLSPYIDNNDELSIEVGKEVHFKLSGQALLFASDISYIDPDGKAQEELINETTNLNDEFDEETD